MFPPRSDSRRRSRRERPVLGTDPTILRRISKTSFYQIPAPQQWYMAPTRSLDLAASSTNAFISSGIEMLMVAMKTTSSLRSWRSCGAWGQTVRGLGSDRAGLGVCGACAGLGPGRSRDYSLELPQIRACTLNAPGSSHCGIAVPHTTGWFRGDTLVRHGVLGVVPTPRPQRGTPFAPRGPGGPFPRLNTTMGHCDSLPPISPRFVSFAWRYHRCVPCSSPSAQDLAGDHPGVFNPVLLPAGAMETARSPKFP